MPVLFRPVVISLGLVLAICCAGRVSAHGPDGDARAGRGVSASARSDAEHLTLALADLSVQHHGRAHGRDRAALESHMLQLAVTRELALTAILETDAAEFLRVALPASIRTRLPISVQAHIEEETDVEGTLEVLHEDGDDYSRYHHVVHTARGRLALKFAGEPLQLLTGSRVRVRGVRLGQTLALTSGATSTQAVSVAALPNTFGAQKTLVILVNFQDLATQPYTAEQARTLVFTTTSNFYLENSHGQTSLSGQVVGWYTIPLSKTVCDYDAIATLARQKATAAGVNLSTYTRHVFAFPKNACTWAGLGSVGGSPSRAWINQNTLTLRVVGHELGHNLGLYHSHSWDCGATVLGGTCTLSDYGDTFDIMGTGSNHMNAFQKERLGWLNYGSSPDITAVTTNGTFTIDPYETPGGVKALKILQHAASNTYYYLEFRQPIGFDASVASYPSVTRGVLAHTGSAVNGNSSRLLDMTPASSSWYDPALVTGQSYYDPAAGVAITPMWANTTNAGVHISFNGPQCVPIAPTIAISPQTHWGSAGAAVTYTAAVTNNDTSLCAPSSFNVTASAPAGWSVTSGGSPVTVAPGTSAPVTITVTPPTSATSGFHTIGVTATDAADPAQSATTSATYAIVTALDATVVTDKTTYIRGGLVKTTTTVRATGSPVAGATVKVTVTRPNGTKVTKSATTTTNGTALVKFSVGTTAPLGLYLVTSEATIAGVSDTATTTYTVH